MATAVSPPSFRALRAGLRETVAAGDVARAQELVDEFHARVMEALQAGDRTLLAELGGQAARLLRAVQSADVAPADAAQALAGDLRRIARTIEIAWTWEAMRGSRQKPATPVQFTVRERVLAELRDAPHRPRDLAAKLQVDRTQVSRALRQLEKAGKIRQGAPSSAEDHRAAYWCAA